MLEANHRRHALVDALRDSGELCTASCEAALRAVPRHLFVPNASIEDAYADIPIAIKRIDGVVVSGASQPSMVAIMLEQLALKPGQTVLEIGTGTGYNTALMAHIVGPSGHVVSVDIDGDMVAAARSHLATTGVTNAAVAHADGAYGHPRGAPYDRIIVTVGAWTIPVAWRDQLTHRGRLVMPIWLRGAAEVVATFERIPNGLASHATVGCKFQRMRGALRGPEGMIAVPGRPGVTVTVDDRSRLDPNSFAALLAGPGNDRTTGMKVTSDNPRGLYSWLALADNRFCVLLAEPGANIVDDVPWLVTQNVRHTCGFYAGDSLALLWLDGEVLTVRTYGAYTELLSALIKALTGWDHAGRPDETRLRLRVLFDNSRSIPTDALVIDKGDARLFVEYE